MKKLVLVVLAISILLTSSCTEQNLLPSNFGIDPTSLADVLTDSTFPKYNFGSNEKFFGFAGKDIRAYDFSRMTLDFISTIAFDLDTKWPKSAKLPSGFIPSKSLNTGKDAGLELSKIHSMGYTGKGVTVAIIDKPIIPTHIEIKDRIQYVGTSTDKHFHGITCASILAGKTCGVAPDANLYYYAVPDDGKNFYNYAQAIYKLIELNSTLDKDNKIRIISISDGIKEDSDDWQEWSDAKIKAENEGIIVLYSNNVGENFIWGGCPPFKDRNDSNNYIAHAFFMDNPAYLSSIILPGDYRTAATNQGVRHYVYWGEGGFSWAIPYLAGLYTIGLQVNPSLDEDELLAIIQNTKSTTADGYSIVNPSGFIDEIERIKP